MQDRNSKKKKCWYCDGGIYSEVAFDFSCRGKDVGFYCKECGELLPPEILLGQIRIKYGINVVIADESVW